MEAGLWFPSLDHFFIATFLRAERVRADARALTRRERGDILMARKMYREAIDVYKEGPLDSAVIWNKIGIAYHQMTADRRSQAMLPKSHQAQSAVLRGDQ